MKRVLLVLFLCVVINSSLKIFNAGQSIIKKISIAEMTGNSLGKPLHFNRQTKLYILLLPNECHCP